MGEAMITALLQLLILLAVIAIVLWAVKQLGLPQPVYVVVVAIGAIIILIWLARFAGIAV